MVVCVQSEHREFWSDGGACSHPDCPYEFKTSWSNLIAASPAALKRLCQSPYPDDNDIEEDFQPTYGPIWQAAGFDSVEEMAWFEMGLDFTGMETA